MKLYSYFRSSAAYRVRIALNLKNVEHEIVPVHLLRDGGEQFSASYRELNPAALVPVLVDGTTVITQSMAIIEYMEESRPGPALLPRDFAARAYVRAAAQTVACEIHPLNNLRVLNYLVAEMGLVEDEKLRWYRHWTETGLGALETLVSRSGLSGRFCCGDSPSIADCVLVPQIFNAERFQCSLEHVPTLVAIANRCRELPAFQRAAPAAQVDCPATA